MELEGLKRGLAVFKEEDVTVEQLVTDRHPSVKKYMREQNADIVHYFDVWHMAKGLLFNFTLLLLNLLFLLIKPTLLRPT